MVMSCNFQFPESPQPTSAPTTTEAHKELWDTNGGESNSVNGHNGNGIIDKSNFFFQI